MIKLTELISEIKVGDKYERIDKQGAGTNQPLVFNTFKISRFNDKKVLIRGGLASGVNTSRLISRKDFDKFVKKYKTVS